MGAFLRWGEERTTWPYLHWEVYRGGIAEGPGWRKAYLHLGGRSASEEPCASSEQIFKCCHYTLIWKEWLIHSSLINIRVWVNLPWSTISSLIALTLLLLEKKFSYILSFTYTYNVGLSLFLFIQLLQNLYCVSLRMEDRRRDRTQTNTSPMEDRGIEKERWDL